MKENIALDYNSADKLISKIKRNHKRLIYIRRRICVVLTIVAMLSLLITSVYAIDVNSKKQIEYKSMVVKSGDSLWSIASNNNGNKDIRTIIREIKKINNISQNTINIGDILMVPVK